MKILNLYAGIGGNRELWGDNHDITAVELSPEIAEVYKSLFPDDTVIIGDAKLQRHFFWLNFEIPRQIFGKAEIRSKNNISDFTGYEAVKNSRIKNKRQVLRNKVNADLGVYILKQGELN